MDLLFRRYADPFLIVSQMLYAGKFAEFIPQIFKKEEEDRLWELYIHSHSNKTFAEYKEEVMIQSTPVSEEDLEATITDSINILEGFLPI